MEKHNREQLANADKEDQRQKGALQDRFARNEVQLHTQNGICEGIMYREVGGYRFDAAFADRSCVVVVVNFCFSFFFFFFIYIFYFVICSDSSGKLIIEISLKGRSNDYKATIVWYAGSDTTHAVTQAAMERAHQEALAKQKETLLAEKQEWQKRFTAKVLYFLHMSP